MVKLESQPGSYLHRGRCALQLLKAAILRGAWGLQIVKVISVFPSKLDSCLLLSA